MRRTVTKSIAIIGEGVSMRTRLYSSGKRQKLCHTTGSDFNSFITSSSIAKPLSVISGNTALPASVINPSRSILRHLSLFSSDQLLRAFLGHSLCAVTPSANFFVVLSIHPKHIPLLQHLYIRTCRRQQVFHVSPPPNIPAPYHDSASAIRVVHHEI